MMVVLDRMFYKTPQSAHNVELAFLHFFLRQSGKFLYSSAYQTDEISFFAMAGRSRSQRSVGTKQRMFQIVQLGAYNFFSVHVKACLPPI